MPKIYIYHNWTSCGLRLTHKVWCVVKVEEKNIRIELYTLEMTHTLLYAINSFFFTIHNRTELSSINFFFLLLLFLRSHSDFCASQKISKNENISGSAMKWNSIHTIESSSSNNSVDRMRKKKKVEGIKITKFMYFRGGTRAAKLFDVNV